MKLQLKPDHIYETNELGGWIAVYVEVRDGGVSWIDRTHARFFDVRTVIRDTPTEFRWRDGRNRELYLKPMTLAVGPKIFTDPPKDLKTLHQRIWKAIDRGEF